jgi:hypothetical protein
MMGSWDHHLNTTLVGNNWRSLKDLFIKIGNHSRLNGGSIASAQFVTNLQKLKGKILVWAKEEN